MDGVVRLISDVTKIFPKQGKDDNVDFAVGTRPTLQMPPPEHNYNKTHGYNIPGEY